MLSGGHPFAYLRRCVEHGLRHCVFSPLLRVGKSLELERVLEGDLREFVGLDRWGRQGSVFPKDFEYLLRPLFGSGVDLLCPSLRLQHGLVEVV